ncbi:MAG: hypothetical protein GXY76_12175 [Chloroflexi bacterium]|nr:hypothetical protein [Chloroflexota bacterium]
MSNAWQRQQRVVESLRRLIYAQPDPTASAELLQKLQEEEEKLHQLESAEQRPAPGGGVLLEAQVGGKHAGDLLGGTTTGIEATVLLRQSHVPISVVHFLDPQDKPLVTFRVKYLGDEYARLRLTSFVEGYSAQAINTVELLDDQEVEIHQLPTFFPDRLRSVTELTRATLHVRIDDLDGATEQHNTFPIWLLARTSAYLGVQDPATGEWLDLSPYLGAWVTPNAPEVLRLLRKALDLHPQRKIVGYQAGAAGVEPQVRAIYQAIKAEGIAYVNSLLAFGGAGAQMQRVRLPRETIRTRSANCIDATVLMASVLEAATLNPALIILPGHALLGWESENGSGEWHYVETTMLGTHDFDAACKAGQIMGQQQEAQAKKLGDPRYFQRLALPALRGERGIMPME